MHKGLNIKIISHWIIVITAIVFLQIIEINDKVNVILTSFIISTLLFNQATFISVNKEKITIIKRILFIIPVCWKSFKLSDVKNVDFHQIENLNIQFEGSTLTGILTGAYFYDSKWKINIDLYYNEVLECDLSLSDREVKNLQTYLVRVLNNKKDS